MFYINIFLQKFSGFPSLPHLLPIFLRGGGRARSRERLAGFCFQFAQTDFFCVCVFLLFLDIRCRQALPAEIIIFKGKISCKHVLPLSVCPGSAKSWAGLLRVPSMHQPPAVTSALPASCAAHSAHLSPCCGAQAGLAQLHEVKDTEGSSKVRLQGLVKREVMPVELHLSILSWWSGHALPWQKASPDVLPAVPLCFSLLMVAPLPAQCSQGWAGSGGCSWAGPPGRGGGTCHLQTQHQLWPLPTWVPTEPHTTAPVRHWPIWTWAS